MIGYVGAADMVHLSQRFESVLSDDLSHSIDQLWLQAYDNTCFIKKLARTFLLEEFGQRAEF